ncbi:MAG: hypothetical protein WCR49_06560 [Opitutae bacterium]
MAFPLSLTKKSDADAAPPLWHTNFRNFERLPDTKVVRTAFFVNTAAIALTVCLSLWFGYQEYHIYSLGEQIAASQKEIDSNAKQNKEAIRLSKIFADEDKKLVEVGNFQRAVILPAELVTLLGQTLPKEIAIMSLDARLAPPTGPGTIQMRGQVAGSPDQAAGYASSYVDLLRAHPRLGTVFDSIVLANLNRDAGNNSLVFDIAMKIKTDAKEKK